MAPKFFIGAAWTPAGVPLDFRPYRLKKKVGAGADFIQTQGIYDIDIFKSQVAKARDLGAQVLGEALHRSVLDALR